MCTHITTDIMNVFMVDIMINMGVIFLHCYSLYLKSFFKYSIAYKSAS